MNAHFLRGSIHIGEISFFIWPKFGKLVSMKLLIFVSMYLPAMSFAVIPCQNLHKDAIQDNLLHNIGIICPPGKEMPDCDARMTYERFAQWSNTDVASVYEHNLAVGRLVCKQTGPDGKETGVMGTGVITLKDDVMVTSAHNFYQNGKQTVDDLSNCFFQTIPPPGKAVQKIYIDEKSLKVGTHYYDPNNSKDDWAVVRLKSNVKNVQPFKVDPRICRVYPGMNGINIAAAADNFGNRNHPPPYIASCDILGVEDGFFRSCCSAGAWSSGSAFACEKSRELYLAGIVDAIHVGIFKNCDSYSSTNGSPVAGRFLNTIRAMADFL